MFVAICFLGVAAYFIVGLIVMRIGCKTSSTLKSCVEDSDLFTFIATMYWPLLTLIFLTRKLGYLFRLIVSK